MAKLYHLKKVSLKQRKKNLGQREKQTGDRDTVKQGYKRTESLKETEKGTERQEEP